jgi:hypothetical protein
MKGKLITYSVMETLEYFELYIHILEKELQNNLEVLLKRSNRFILDVHIW